MKKSTMIPLSIVLIPAAVWAEFFIDVYGGQSRTQSGSFSASEDRDVEVPGGVLTSQGDLGGSKSNGLGLRGGYWDKNLKWLGAAAEISHFGADAQDSDAEVRLTSFSLMLMFRYPLMMNEEYSNGRFFPYAGIGVSRATVDISAPSDLASGSVGSDVGGVFFTGVKWMFTPSFGLFAEYRVISISFEESETTTTHDFFGWSHTRTFEIKGDVQARQIMGGVSFHF